MSVKKNNAANEPLITAGWIFVTNKNNATGIPPNVVNPFKVPEIIPVKIFAWSLFIFLFEYPFINKIEKKIIIKHTYKCVVSGERYFKRYNPRSICVEIWDSEEGFKKNKVYKFLIKKKYLFVAKKRENYIFFKKK